MNKPTLQHSHSLLALSTSSLASSSASSPVLGSSSSERKYGTVNKTMSSQYRTLFNRNETVKENQDYDSNLNSISRATATTTTNELEKVLGLHIDDHLEVSITENSNRKRFRVRKKQDLDSVLTVYVTASASSSTLTRRRQEINDLDLKLRSDLSLHLPSFNQLITPPSTPPKKRTVLAAISSSLTPRRSNPPSPAPSTALSSTNSSASQLGLLDVTDLSAYLTTLSRHASVRSHPAWKSFFAVRHNDLESTRIERRITRTQSDQTLATRSRSTPGGSMRSRLNDSSTNEHDDEEEEEEEEDGGGSSFRSERGGSLRIRQGRSEMLLGGRNGNGNGRRSKRRTSRNGVGIDSFEIMRVLGKGCAGKVLLVRRKGVSGELFALKAIQKNHVLAHRELEHTRTEQGVLKRCSRDSSNPFVVKLFYSFHDRTTLYLALQFHNGGDLATQLARWGRLGRDRARFYAAEIVEGVSGLHRAGIIYRDLKPENILISSEGHIVLTDFGLSKDFHHHSPRPFDAFSSWSSRQRETTLTFCGTAEYLAPEVLLGEPYSYEVDSWSLGNMLYEMLGGVTPFWAENHAEMYKNVLHAQLTFDEDAQVFDDDTKNLLRGLLQRDPLLRMTDERIKRHPYFSSISWDHVFNRRYVAPFIPSLNPDNDLDTQNFDDTFLSMNPAVEAEEDELGSDREPPEGEPQCGYDEDGNDVFDGYSYFGEGIEDDDDDDARSEDGQSRGEEEEEEVIIARGRDTSSSSMDTDSTPISTKLTHSSSSTSSMSASLHKSTTREGDTLAPVILEEELDEEAEEEEEWDLVDRNVLGEAKNGGRESTLWALGVRDRYRLLISPSTPRSSPRPSLPGQASFLSRSSSKNFGSGSLGRKSDRGAEEKGSTRRTTTTTPTKLSKSPSSRSQRSLPSEYASRRVSGDDVDSRVRDGGREKEEEEEEPATIRAKRGAFKRTLSVFMPKLSA